MMQPVTEIPLFTFPTRESLQGWQAINDVVMGGRSVGEVEWQPPGVLVFTGTVSLIGGGFASVRSPAGDYNLAAVRGLRLLVQGDGKRYKVNLRTDLSYDGIAYQAGFQTAPGEWLTVDLAFADFQPTYHGRVPSRATPLAPAEIKSFGLVIADRQEGPFRLAVQSIMAVGASA